MIDLQSRSLILAKGLLLLALGGLASLILLLHAPSVTIALLHLVAIWAFCRCYYLAFYVIEHYVDSQYRFSGLYSFLRYVVRSKAGVTRDNGA
jgi:hypothetical protein